MPDERIVATPLISFVGTVSAVAVEVFAKFIYINPIMFETKLLEGCVCSRMIIGHFDCVPRCSVQVTYASIG